ncbi:MAG: hypothetical protein M3Z49_04445 [Bifidobacteriales bacterium]|nr:hypothetical protein [Bifidobacteriales bacterium]
MPFRHLRWSPPHRCTEKNDAPIAAQLFIAPVTNERMQKAKFGLAPKSNGKTIKLTRKETAASAKLILAVSMQHFFEATNYLF